MLMIIFFFILIARSPPKVDEQGIHFIYQNCLLVELKSFNFVEMFFSANIKRALNFNVFCLYYRFG